MRKGTRDQDDPTITLPANSGQMDEKTQQQEGDLQNIRTDFHTRWCVKHPQVHLIIFDPPPKMF